VIQSASMRLGLLAAALVVSLPACKDHDPKQTERTEPWPAQPAASENPSRAPRRERYTLAAGQVIDFELKTRDSLIQGTFPLVRGSLELDLMHLKDSLAKLSIDLGAVRIRTGTDDEQIAYSLSAQNWLNVGASVPEAARESRRWASFFVESIQETTSEAAHEAKRDAKRERQAREVVASDSSSSAAASSSAPGAAPLASGSASAAESAPPAPVELRVARADLVGSLELNELRVTRNYTVTLEFHYPAPATPGLVPDSIVVQSARDLRIPLEQHRITPRDAAGVRVASELKLLGKEVGETAVVSFALRFVPERAAREDL
jgi:hypothetical protein